jgi:hypothetical protein
MVRQVVLSPLVSWDDVTLSEDDERWIANLMKSYDQCRDVVLAAYLEANRKGEDAVRILIQSRSPLVSSHSI